MTKKCSPRKLSPWWWLILMRLLIKASQLTFREVCSIGKVTQNILQHYWQARELCLCVCVCVRERERERESMCLCVWAALMLLFVKNPLQTLNASLSLIAYWKRVPIFEIQMYLQNLNTLLLSNILNYKVTPSCKSKKHFERRG